jgi:hypothetical protein
VGNEKSEDSRLRVQDSKVYVFLAAGNYGKYKQLIGESDGYLDQRLCLRFTG